MSVSSVSTPFVFGRMAEEENFTNRKQERKHLEQNFRSLTNTIIISPRRWGKSSLVARVSKDVMSKDKKIRACTVDLFNVRDESEFYAQLASAVITSTSAKWEEWLSLAKEFLYQLRPQISFTSDMREEISFDVEWERIAGDPDEILDLAEKVAQAKKVKIVVCIDEFQAIGDFKDSLAIQRKLRSHWQKHQNVCYCLYGSKQHMLLDIFESSDMPFYRFGDMMQLEKITNSDWTDFIKERFEATGKRIDIHEASYLANSVENHPYYVQQLAQQVWLRTNEKADKSTIDEALQGLIDQLGLVFSNTADMLTNKQLSFIKALINEETQLSSASVLKQYNLGTSASIPRLKERLEKLEIIDTTEGKITILDPLFKLWLERCFYLR